MGQVYLPGKTQSYADKQDAPETQIGMCTLKFFPFKILHTIHYAREMWFEGLFTIEAQDVNRLIQEPKDLKDDLLADVKVNPKAALFKIQALRENALARPKTFTDCIHWARSCGVLWACCSIIFCYIHTYIASIDTIIPLVVKFVPPH